MKTSSFSASRAVLRGLLCAACAASVATALPAFAFGSSTKYSPAGDRHDLYGDPTSIEGTTRTIVITPDTKWINVQGGEFIKFVVGDKTFGWAFNVGQGISSFDLLLVAPPGVLDRHVMAYVSPDPKYSYR